MEHTTTTHTLTALLEELVQLLTLERRALSSGDGDTALEVANTKNDLLDKLSEQNISSMDRNVESLLNECRKINQENQKLVSLRVKVNKKSIENIKSHQCIRDIVLYDREGIVHHKISSPALLEV